MNWSAVGALMLALGVGLGAFGAHGLKMRLDAYSMSIYEKAVFYHFIHALGLLIAPLLARSAAADRACWLLMTGILLFSGSLYLLAVTGSTRLGMITPLGGVAFIAGWLQLAWAIYSGNRNN